MNRHIVIGIAFFLLVGTPVSAQYQVVPNHVTDASVPPTVYLQQDPQLQEQCDSCSYITYRLVRQLNCGAVTEIRDGESSGNNNGDGTGAGGSTGDGGGEGKGEQSSLPVCRMVPRVSTGGAVELEWDTINATVAFIDFGVGHVNTEQGARIVTPKADTTYNMTVLDEDGRVGVCSARINIGTSQGNITNTTGITDAQNAQSSQQGNVQGGSSLGTDIGGTQEAQNSGIYAYNEDAVKRGIDTTLDTAEKTFAKSNTIAHTATMLVNDTTEKSTSFFTSGLFLVIAFLVLLLLALWLIVKWGLR